MSSSRKSQRYWNWFVLRWRSTDYKLTQEQVEGVHSVHNLHIWRLGEHEAIASAHIVLTPGADLSQDTSNQLCRPSDSRASPISSLVIEPKESTILCSHDMPRDLEEGVETASNVRLRRISNALKQTLNGFGIHCMTVQIEDYVSSADSSVRSSGADEAGNSGCHSYMGAKDAC